MAKPDKKICPQCGQNCFYRCLQDDPNAPSIVDDLGDEYSSGYIDVGYVCGNCTYEELTPAGRAAVPPITLPWRNPTVSP